MTVPGTDAAAVRPDGRVIGVDLGRRRIGVAVCDSRQRVATGARAIERTGDEGRDHRLLLEVVEDYEAVGIVVGLPLSLTGQVGPAAAAAAAEVERLRGASPVPVAVIDERLTTVTAHASLRAAGLQGGRRQGQRRRQIVDQTAAAVLLQAWIDQRAESEERTDG